MELVEILEKLSNAYGVAGREDEVRNMLKEMLRPYVDELWEDKLGNVIGVKKAKREDAPSIMLAAHMDEIGLYVRNITEKGFLYFTKIGGIDDRILLAQKVVVQTSKGIIPGVIGAKPVHIMKEEERKKVIEADKLFVDIGATSKKEAEEMGVRVGDPICLDIKFAKAAGNTVIGQALDSRVGCAAMIEIMKRLGEVDCTVYAVGTIQEEVGLRGAATAAFKIYPDIGIALDVTVAGDVPGVSETEAPIKMGAGPSFTVADRGLITHPKVLRLLVETAEKIGVPYQLEAGLPGSTDAARIALTREGVPAAVVSIPTRYIHSAASLLNLKDVEAAIKVVVAAIENLPNYL